MNMRLTKRRLEAIRFALDFVLAGDVDETIACTDGEVSSDDLHKALEWATETVLDRAYLHTDHAPPQPRSAKEKRTP